MCTFSRGGRFCSGTSSGVFNCGFVSPGCGVSFSSLGFSGSSVLGVNVSCLGFVCSGVKDFRGISSLALDSGVNDIRLSSSLSLASVVKDFRWISSLGLVSAVRDFREVGLSPTGLVFSGSGVKDLRVVVLPGANFSSGFFSSGFSFLVSFSLKPSSMWLVGRISGVFCV